MSGFTKLVPEIIQSSIWNESPEVRCVWIAMIAMKDQDGNLRGNNQTIARMANVPLDWADKALEKFQSPDPYSNNPTNEGRRIEAIPGGWHIVSHELYRAKDYREVEAERKKKYRENKAMSRTCPGHVPDSSASVSVSDSVLEKEVKGEENLPFDSEAFKAAWNEWKKFRSESRKSLKPSTIKKQLAFLAKIGEEKAIKSMGTSILNGWQGLFEPEEKGANGTEKKEKPIWRDCAARCRFWSDKWKSCDKRETVEPKSCECCTWFR